MSNADRDSSADIAALASKKSSSTMTSAPSGLESIVLVALQALQKEHIHKLDVEEPITTLPTSTAIPPLPTFMDSAIRVVSTDSVGVIDEVGEFKAPHIPPQVKEEETMSSSANDAETNLCSSPVESTTRSVAPSSPSPFPAPSETISEDCTTSKDGTSSKSADFSHILADPEAWLQKTENLFANLPPVDRSSDNDIVVQPNDVLCGRGGETNHHPGNIRYRSLVKAYQKLYLLAKRRDKPKIAQCIVVSVRGVNGRFLKRTKNANNAGGSSWVDVGNVKAREKTSQALREGAPNLRENTNPPVTGAVNDITSVSGRQVLVPEQKESITAPSSTGTTLPTSTPTALEAMMGWKMPPAGFNSATSKATGNVSTPSMPPVTSSSSLAASVTDTDALTAQLFTKAVAQLMQHPTFHQLDQAQQQEAILFELKNAKATVETAKRTPSSKVKPTPANVHDQGRTSPLVPKSSVKQQVPPQPQQHPQSYNPLEHPPFYHPGQHHYYQHMYGGYWPDGNTNKPKVPSSMDTGPDKVGSVPSLKTSAPPQVDKSFNLQTMYHELLVAKAAAAAGSSSSLTSVKTMDGTRSPSDETNENRLKTKKRPAPSSTSTVDSMDSAGLTTSSLPARSPTVVSDTGSDISSSSSSCSSSVANNFESFSTASCKAPQNTLKNDKSEVASVSRRGSRLKRLKLRMKDDFN
jgi:hypothetical protein